MIWGHAIQLARALLGEPFFPNSSSPCSKRWGVPLKARHTENKHKHIYEKQARHVLEMCSTRMVAFYSRRFFVQVVVFALSASAVSRYPIQNIFLLRSLPLVLQGKSRHSVFLTCSERYPQGSVMEPAVSGLLVTYHFFARSRICT